MSDRSNCLVLGRIIGTYEGWDEVDNEIQQYHEFDPAAGVNLPQTKILTVDYSRGQFYTTEENETNSFCEDMLTVLSGVAISDEADRFEITTNEPKNAGPSEDGASEQSFSDDTKSAGDYPPGGGDDDGNTDVPGSDE